MKKILFIITTCLILLTFTSCYQDEKKVEILEIKIYDVYGEEIPGVYMNGAGKSGFYDLNSAAPVLKYLVVNVKEHDSIKIVVKIKNKLSPLTSIKINVSDNFKEYTIKEYNNITTNDDGIYLTINLTDVNKDENTFSFYTCMTKKDGDYYFGSKGGNTYISGFHLSFNEEQLTSF